MVGGRRCRGSEGVIGELDAYVVGIVSVGERLEGGSRNLEVETTWRGQRKVGWDLWRG